MAIKITAEVADGIEALAEADKPVLRYELREEHVQNWRDWFEINGIETDQIVRDQQVELQGSRVRVLLFALDESGRRQVCCDCAHITVGVNHFKKRLAWFPVAVALHPWAEACRVAEGTPLGLGDV